MRKFKKLLSHPKKQSGTFQSQNVLSQNDTVAPDATVNPPNYAQAELEQVRSELEAVRLQLSRVQAANAGSSNLLPGDREPEPPSYEQHSADRLAPPLAQLSAEPRVDTHEVSYFDELARGATSRPPLQSPGNNSHSQSQPQTQAPPISQRSPVHGQHNLQSTPSNASENRNAITFLAANGFDVSAENFDVRKKAEALVFALTRGNEAAARVLIERGAYGINKSWLPPNSESALTIAARAGNVEIVRMLLETTHESSLTDHDALSKAVGAQRLEVVRQLLVKWPAVSVRHSHSREGALCIAVERGYEEIATLILQNGIRETTEIEMGDQSALFKAVNRGNTNMVKLLLDHKMGRFQIMLWGQSPHRVKDVLLERAIEKGNEGIAELLIEHGASGQVAFEKAVKGNYESIVKQLIANGGKPILGLDTAIQQGNKLMVQLLLDNGAGVGAALLKATSNDRPEVAEMCLKRGARVTTVNSTGWSPLHLAAEKGNCDLARLLIGHNAKIEIKTVVGWTPLHIATMNCNEAMVRLLLEHEADLSTEDKNGQTTWLHAIQKGDLATIRTLLDFGASHYPGNRRASIQHAFEDLVRRGSTEIIELLLHNGIEIDISVGFGVKSLLTAAEEGRASIVKLLLDAGTDIQGKDDRGRTALHLAAMNGHYQVVCLLLERGADPNVVNKFGRTAEYWASNNGHAQVSRLLKDKAATYRAKPLSKAVTNSREPFESKKQLSKNLQQNETSSDISQKKQLPESSSQNVNTGADPSRLYNAYKTTGKGRTDSAAILRWD